MTQSIRRLRSPRLYVALFFALLTLTGLLTIRDYGAPYDELTEMQILQSSLKEYALRLNPDSQGFYATLNAVRASESTEREHGSSAYYALAPWMGRLTQDTRLFSLVWSAATWVWFMLGCLALYGFLRRMGMARLPACAGVLLLFLMPRFFAEGHYNNKDVVMLSLTLLTLYFGARLMERPGVPSALLFALSAAIATNMRVIGVAVFGLTGLMIAVSVFARRQWNKRTLFAACATLVGYLGFYMLLTPAMWGNPVEQIRFTLQSSSAFARWNNMILFRGAEFPDPGGSTPLPVYYLPYLMLTTIPLYTTGLALLGTGALAARWLKQRRGFLQDTANLLPLTAALILIVPLVYAVVMRPMVYNGWRHFYFVYAGFVILAGYGIHALLQWTGNRKAAKAFVAVALCACLLFTGAGMVQNHPYQFAYYNALIPRDRDSYMELDYWNVGFAGAFHQLVELKQDTGEPLVVGCYFNDISIGTFKLPEAIASRLTITTSRDAPYLCYNTLYAHIYRVQEPPEGYHTLFTVQSYGNAIITMYERDESL